jgi:hypothetical protein
MSSMEDVTSLAANENAASETDASSSAAAAAAAAAPSAAVPNEVVTSFAMKNVHTSQSGQQVQMPLEVTQYLATNNLKDKKNKELKVLRDQLTMLAPAVKQYLDGMEDKEISVANLTPHESSLLGPRGKLKYVARTRKSDTCTQALLQERLTEFTLREIPTSTPDQADLFAKAAVVHVWEGIETKTTYVLERTQPKKRPARAAGAVGNGMSLMNDM